VQNSPSDLDLYAKVEDMLGVKEVAPKLYKEYLKILKDIEFNSLVDIGCGSGDFLALLNQILPNIKLLGVDKSPLMVQQTKQKGLDATLSLNSITSQFDIATATFDMINYLEPNKIKEFFNSLEKIVKKGGYFIFDTNSYFGLSQLAVGNFIAEDKNRFLAIESFFENNTYSSYFSLFEKSSNCYNKQNATIYQYYYNKEFFKSLNNWQLIDSFDISLYDDEKPDKSLYILKRD